MKFSLNRSKSWEQKSPSFRKSKYTSTRFQKNPILHPRNLTARPWKMMAGRRSLSFWVRYIFRGELLNFQGVLAFLKLQLDRGTVSQTAKRVGSINGSWFRRWIASKFSMGGFTNGKWEIFENISSFSLKPGVEETGGTMNWKQLTYFPWMKPCCAETLSIPSSIKVDSWCCQTASLSILGHLQTGEEHADANSVLQKQAEPPCTWPMGRSSLHAKGSFRQCMFLLMLKHTLVKESLLFARSWLRCWCVCWFFVFGEWTTIWQLNFCDTIVRIAVLLFQPALESGSSKNSQRHSWRMPRLTGIQQDFRISRIKSWEVWTWVHII